MTSLSQVRTGSAMRGAGVALACLLPRLPDRARVVAASYAAAWPVDRPGLQVIGVIPDEHVERWKRAVLPLATSGASWTALMLVGVSAVRRSALPAPVAAVLLGGVVTVADSLAADFGARVKARAAAAAMARDAASSEPRPAPA
jgi:hypothetical protein